MHIAVFAGFGKCGLGLKIEVFLATDVQREGQPMFGPCHGQSCVTLFHRVWRRFSIQTWVKRLDGEGGLDAKDGGQGVDLDDDGGSGGAGFVEGVGDDDGEGLTVVGDLATHGDEQGLVFADGADVVVAGDVGGGQHQTHAGHTGGAADVEATQETAGNGAAHRPDLEAAAALGDVVDVGQPLATLHHDDRGKDDAIARLVSAYVIGDVGAPFTAPTLFGTRIAS